MQVLQIAGVGDIYGALDEYTAATKVTLQEGEAMKRSLFEKLPQVLFFSLQRMDFTDGGATGKKSDTFSFPRVLFMDRYLHKNRGRADAHRFSSDVFCVLIVSERW